MIESPVNRMIGSAERNRSSGHIKEIGPHQHRWEHVGADPRGELYRVCRDCGTRTVKSGNFREAVRQDWLAGGEWAPDAEAETEAEAAPTSHEDFAFSRRRGRPPKNGGSGSDEERA